MNKLLITGGLGNLGSWLTEYFCLNGYEVWVLSKNYRKLETKVKFHLLHCDIVNPKEISSKLDDIEFDYVIHAASVNDGFVPDYGRISLEINALGTRNLLEYFKTRNIKNFIYLSTFQVYGKYDGLITEDTITLPKNDYGTTHLFSEYYIKQFFYSNQIKHTIIRLTNSYGAPKDHQSSKWYLVLNDLAKSAFENKQIVLKSNGLAPRDFIWMGNVCEVFKSLFDTEASNETYNLSGGETIRMIDVANYVKQAYFEAFGIEIPVIVNSEDKTIYSDTLKVDNQKLKSFIKFNLDNKFVEEAKNIFNLLASK